MQWIRVLLVNMPVTRPLDLARWKGNICGGIGLNLIAGDLLVPVEVLEEVLEEVLVDGKSGNC
jgi:hypothetical protein